MDLFFGVAIWAMVGGVFLLYAVRVLVAGRVRSARADKDGGSPILSKHFVEYSQWLLNPLGRFLVRLGVTSDAVTWFSLLPGIGAGIAAAFGWFGLCGFLGTIACFADSLDGMLARLSGKSSEAGETLDAIADRYAESAAFIGMLVHYRYSVLFTTLTAVAFLGAWMVSYTSAKAEAQGVEPPRGLMRRNERALYLMMGASLTPIATHYASSEASVYLREAPMLIGLLLIAVIANLSSFARVSSIRRSLRAQEAKDSALGESNLVLKLEPRSNSSSIVSKQPS